MLKIKGVNLHDNFSLCYNIWKKLISSSHKDDFSVYIVLKAKKWIKSFFSFTSNISKKNIINAFFLKSHPYATRVQSQRIKSFWTDFSRTNHPPPPVIVRWPHQKVPLSDFSHWITFTPLTPIVGATYEYKLEGTPSWSAVLLPGLHQFLPLNQLPWILKNLPMYMTLIIVYFWIQVSKWIENEQK